MSEVVNPPDYYFTGINFNPAFYAEDTTGLSQSLANTLYLRKTVPDTATAQETFLSGIITPTINSTSTGFLNVVVPMVDSASGLNMAVAPRTISGQVHHYSDGDNCVAGAGVHLNNGLNNNSATNIHNGTGANPSGIVNIMSGTSNTGTVNIGTTGTTINVKGSKIRQVTPLISGGTIETVIGNADNISSLSTTFNRKDQIAGSLAIPCYRIVSPAQYNTQYCELVVSGANYGLGGYSAKYYFILQTPGGTIVAPTVNLFYGVGGNPTITFTIESTTTMTLNINAGMTGTTRQTFVSTLIAYPSINIDNPLNDYSITAI